MQENDWKATREVSGVWSVTRHKSKREEREKAVNILARKEEAVAEAFLRAKTDGVCAYLQDGGECKEIEA